MKVKNKSKFILGIVDIIVGIALVITCICLHRTSRIVFAFFPVFCGIGCLLDTIQTEKEREARRKELEAMFKKGDEE